MSTKFEFLVGLSLPFEISLVVFSTLITKSVSAISSNAVGLTEIRFMNDLIFYIFLFWFYKFCYCYYHYYIVLVNIF